MNVHGGQRCVTRLLDLFSEGDAEAHEDLVLMTYAELRKLAQAHMGREGVGHTLQATALVHEFWSKLAGLEERPRWPTRGHFFKWTSKVMGNLLRDHARKKSAQKSGGDRLKIALEGDELISGAGSPERLVDILDAMKDLSELDEELGSLVELRAIGGFSYSEISDLTGMSKSKVDHSLHAARAWLRHRLA